MTHWTAFYSNLVQNKPAVLKQVPLGVLANFKTTKNQVKGPLNIVVNNGVNHWNIQSMSNMHICKPVLKNANL